ncbi:MAG: nuclear transport factor 2 family protein [Chloroflexi bacterium]|nr:nuclear transport factor 2 family protein [Chloroflexota bacterium]
MTLEREEAYLIVERYVEGWKANNPSDILSVLSRDCVIRESHGPTYRGKELVEEWVKEWMRAGNTVERWDVENFVYEWELASFEWDFECTVDGEKRRLLGASVVRFEGREIAEMREYRMTQAPFDWSRGRA